MKHTALILAAIPAAALAQAPVDPVYKRAWQENTGWTNWRDANNATQGARDHRTFLSGFVWGENIGWINLGDGSPANGLTYANIGSDCGVNVQQSGALSGFAWGENVGWINFLGGQLATPAQPARIDSGGAITGYAWGENIGWLRHNVPGMFVAFRCYANCDGSTTGPVLNVQDFACFLNAFAAGSAAANCDRSTNAPVLNVADFSCFLNAFAAGCP